LNYLREAMMTPRFFPAPGEVRVAEMRRQRVGIM
jgi:hypothetical protein